MVEHKYSLLSEIEIYNAVRVLERAGRLDDKQLRAQLRYMYLSRMRARIPEQNKTSPFGSYSLQDPDSAAAAVRLVPGRRIALQTIVYMVLTQAMPVVIIQLVYIR